MVAVRPILLGLALFALNVPAAAAAENLTISSRETVHHHMRAADVRHACRAREVDACTEYLEKRFEVRCAAEGETWHLVANLHLVLAIHLSAPRFLAHERMHVEDVRASLESYFEPFLAQRFQDEAACASTGRLLSQPSFARVLIRDLLAASNEKFGCGPVRMDR